MAGAVGTILSGWRRFYGANPLHLIAVLAGAALTGYVVSFVVTESMATWMLVWFVGALVAHDLILFPLYAMADRSLFVGRWARRRLTRRHEPRIPVINHLRVPAMGSGLLLLVFLPMIIGQGESAYVTATGMSTAPYFERWLWASAVLFAASAAIYVVRLVVVAAVNLRSTSGTEAAPARDTASHNSAIDGAPIDNAPIDGAPADDAADRSKPEVGSRESECSAPGQNPPPSARAGVVDGGAARRVDHPEPERTTVDKRDDNADPCSEDGRS